MTKLDELGRLVAQEQDATRAPQVRDPRAAERFAREVGRSAACAIRKRWSTGSSRSPSTRRRTASGDDSATDG